MTIAAINHILATFGHNFSPWGRFVMAQFHLYAVNIPGVGLRYVLRVR